MTTIGDKKVSLALQDGSSINLNKPKVLPASITKIADIKEPGWYIGGTVPQSLETVPQSLEDESTLVTLSSDDGVSGQTITSDEKFDDMTDDKSKWTIDYMNLHLVKLMSGNFTEENIHYLEKVAKIAMNNNSKKDTTSKSSDNDKERG